MKKDFSQKIFNVALAFALVSPITGMADSFWARGVSETEGWFDINKVYNPCVFWNDTSAQQPADIVNSTYLPAGTDRYLCWAATSANVLQYLYVQAGGTFKASSTYSLKIADKLNFSEWTSHVRQSEFMEIFVKNYQDTGGNAVDGISWYATGKTAYNYAGTGREPFNLKADAPNKNGFGYSSDPIAFRNNYISHYQVEGSNYGGTYILPNIKAGTVSYSKYFQECIKESPIALSIDTKERNAGHAITCWGYDTDTDGNIVKIYVTDSDDGIDKIKSYGVNQDEDGYLSLIIPQGETYKYYLGDTDTEAGYIGRELASDGKYYITSFSGYKNFFVGTIPEPSFFGVFAGMVAIALAGTRRRRKL